LILFEAIFGLKLWKNDKDIKSVVKTKLTLAKRGHEASSVAAAVTQTLGVGKTFEELDPALRKILEITTR